MSKKFDFHQLVTTTQQVDKNLIIQTSKAINISLTLRNWLIGLTIVEYERNASDQSAYGKELFETLSISLKKIKVTRVETEELRRYKAFYQMYPQIREALSPELHFLIKPILESNDSFLEKHLQQPLNKPEDKSQEDLLELQLPGKTLLQNLSFSHFCELLRLEVPLRRTFYEEECISGDWSVRELQKQISMLYYEHWGFAKNNRNLVKRVQKEAEKTDPLLTVRDPYVFEFIGLKPKEVIREPDLEKVLLNNMKDFLLDLGNGFCFEARQKMVLIRDQNFFVDLVFYHRILKCHILIELKTEKFGYEYIGQLNTHVVWYKKNEMMEGD